MAQTEMDQSIEVLGLFQTTSLNFLIVRIPQPSSPSARALWKSPSIELPPPTQSFPAVNHTNQSIPRQEEPLSNPLLHPRSQALRPLHNFHFIKHRSRCPAQLGDAAPSPSPQRGQLGKVFFVPQKSRTRLAQPWRH